MADDAAYVITGKGLSIREERLLLELMDLRRERIRIDRRIREVLMLQRIDRGLPPHRNMSGDPTPPSASSPSESPCHCLRCDYAWFPADPTRAPKCCSRCGSSHWMLPPTPTSRKPGDPEPASWARRKDPRTRLRDRAIREKQEAEGKKAAAAVAPVPPVAHPWDRPLTLPPTSASQPAFPPPPSVAGIMPPPPSPSAVSLSARLAAARAQDLSPEQPERQASMSPSVTAPPIIEETPPNQIESIEIVEEMPVEQVRAMYPEADIPASEIGVPSTDAEREALARAQEAAWPTTKSE